MRLFLLPVSTRRTLLYCQRLNVATAEGTGLVDKAQARAAKLWADWEKKDKGWKKKVVSYGNYALRRIPFEEWGLKSVPPLSVRRQDDEKAGRSEIEVVYPQTLIPMDRVAGVLHTLSTEREALHRRKLIWCFVGMPITAPIAILPVIPNLPFFYLVYRAWSHWRAIAGGKHIQFLLQNNLLTLTPSSIADEVYARQRPPLPSSGEPTTNENGEEADRPRNLNPPGAEDPNPDGETMLLSQENGKRMTRVLDLPQLEVELERAIWQVEAAMQKQNAEKKNATKEDAAKKEKDE